MPRSGVCHIETEGGKMKLVSSLFLPQLLLIQVCVCFPGANLTSNLDRIKIVFTPMRCRRLCSGGHCYNSCEKGDVTTVYSETSQQQQQQPKNQGFRLCESNPDPQNITEPLSFWTVTHPWVLLFSLTGCLPYALILTHLTFVSILLSISFFIGWAWQNEFPVACCLLWMPSPERRQSGKMKAESCAKNSYCHRERETGSTRLKSRLCKRGLISPHTHTWSWWSHAPST